MGIVDSFLTILTAALFITIIFQQLKIPIILGYVLVGVLLGPHVLGWFPNTRIIKDLSEFGVVLLMFTAGIEFSLPKLLSLKFPVFVLGGLQVLISLLITTAIGLWLGMSFISSIIMGSVVAMSSTAIVIKQLAEQLELNTTHGNNAVGILLCQDLAVIPILVYISSLTGSVSQPILTTLVTSLFKGCIAIFIILISGKWLLRPLFRIIVSTGTVELFTLSVLFVAVGSAWLTNFLGLSYALGAFLAGMMLAECEYRDQIIIEVRPFRDILLGLFFISVGMLVNITLWPKTWLWILLLVVGLMIGKMLLIFLLNRLCRYELTTSTRTGLVLAQGGEFGFAILTLALTNSLLPNDWGQSVLGALLISFVFAPIIVLYNQGIANFILRLKQ